MIDIKLGDCLELMKNIKNQSIDVIITDPPYKYLKNQEFDRDFDEEIFFNECKRVLNKDGFVVLFGRGTSFYRWNNILDKLGFTFKEEIIWNKKMTSTIFNPISRTHETISIYTKGNGKINNVKIPYTVARKYDLENIVNDVKRIKGALKNNDKLEILQSYLETQTIKYSGNIKPSKFCVTVGKNVKNRERSVHCLKNIVEGLKEKDVIDVKPVHYNMKHPTEKPVELIERLINLVSNEGNIILDSFMGSGSTGVACINTNRNFIGIELDKKYFEIARERLKMEE